MLHETRQRWIHNGFEYIMSTHHVCIYIPCVFVAFACRRTAGGLIFFVFDVSPYASSSPPGWQGLSEVILATNSWPEQPHSWLHPPWFLAAHTSTSYHGFIVKMLRQRLPRSCCPQRWIGMMHCLAPLHGRYVLQWLRY